MACWDGKDFLQETRETPERHQRHQRDARETPESHESHKKAARKELPASVEGDGSLDLRPQGHTHKRAHRRTHTHTYRV